MKKLYFILAALMTIISSAKADVSNVEFTAALFGIGMDQSIDINGREIACGATTIVFNQGTNGLEAPTYNDAQGCVKFKQGHTLTISGATINKIEIWCTSAFNGITATNTSVSTGTVTQSSAKTTWEGIANEVVFTRIQSNPVNVSEIIVYYTAADAAPAAPLIEGTDNFKGSTTVTMTATGDIFYTTDGTTPTADSDPYTGPFTISETTTVKAIAVVNGKSSEVAEATFTKSDIIDIAEAIQMPNKTTVKIEGTVVATNERGLLLYDGTGYIYYFNTSLNGAYSVGDHLVMSGALATYSGFKQLTNTATVEKTGVDSFKHPAPVVLDGEALDAWASAPVIENARIAGKLTIENNYYNVAVEGAATIGSVVYPEAALKAKLENGKEYTFTGYLIYTTSSGKYANIVVNDVMEGNITNAKTFVLSYNSWNEKKEDNVATFTAPDDTEFTITATTNGTTPMSSKLSTSHVGYETFVVDDEEYDQIYFLSSWSPMVTFTVATTTESATLIEATLCQGGSSVQLRNPDKTTETIYSLPSHYANSDDQYVEGEYNTVDLAEWGFRFTPYSSIDGVVKVTYIKKDVETGISNVNENVNANNIIYNLAGQRVNANQKGIVIMNGKKVLVK